MKFFVNPGDIVPQYIMESSSSHRVKFGYPKHLLECVNKRTFLESSALVASTLGRIADKTLASLAKENSADPIRFNALSVFDDTVNDIRQLIATQYKESKDIPTKQELAKLYEMTQGGFLARDNEILRKALDRAKKSGGNRLAIFIKEIIVQVAANNAANPIEAFKTQVMNLKEAIAVYFDPKFTFQNRLKKYQDALLNGDNSLIAIMQDISNELVNSQEEIKKLSKSHMTDLGTGNSKFDKLSDKDMASKISNVQTNHMYESEVAFLEAYAASLDYFSRK